MLTISDTLKTKSSAASARPGIQKHHKFFSALKVQPKLSAGAADDPCEREADAPPIVQDVISGGGQPLDGSTKYFFESRFGHDFSNVKIHTGSKAAESSQAINAHAFTLGNNIVFNEGKYDSGTDDGRKLLAHELTHVLQQGQSDGLKLQRASQAVAVTSSLGLGPLYDYNNAYLILSPLNAVDMLDTLLELFYASPTIFHGLIGNLPWAAGPIGSDRLLVYFLGVKNALFQNNITGAELTSLTTLITTLPIDQQQAIQTFTITHRTGVTRDLYTGAHLPTATEQGQVETVLNPGATFTAPVAAGAPVSITLAPPNPVCSNVAGLSTQIRTVLTPRITSEAAAFRQRRVVGPNFPIASANSMANLAQNEVENYFRPYLARATRSLAPGTYSLGGATRASAMLRDQSVTPQWRTTDGRLGWLKYWYNHLTGNLNSTLHCNQSQIEDALRTMATDAALIPDIDDYINSWPAEATGGINIQPYLDASQLVCQRWDTFTTIIHEFIHILAHPNFQNAENVLPNDALEVLKEGMDDVLRKELWQGTGLLYNQLISPARNSDRAVIEGGNFPLDTSKVCSHSYYDNLPAAESIAGIVGNNNVKLAYFLGQTEYLGLGSGTTTNVPNALSATSFYNASDSTNQDVVTLFPGETREQLLLRTNGSEIRDLGNTVIPPGQPIPASVRIPGIRKIYVHQNDSVSSIAVQNGVSPYEIMRANNLNTPSVVVGSRLLIPRH